MPRPLASRPVLPLPVRLRADVRATGRGIGIAMVDSDFVAHPDLTHPKNRIARYIDAVNNKVKDMPPKIAVQSRHWHGTMTAVTAAGNGYLSQGVFSSLAPESTVTLVRTMNDKGRVTTDVIVRALQRIGEFADELNIRVVNISVYADELDQTLDHPVNRAVEDLVAQGIVVVCAAGNNPNVPIRPPAAAVSGLAVGGLDDKNTLMEDDNEMYHSTFGTTLLGVQKPEIIAPAIWLPAPIMQGTEQQTEAAALCSMDMMTDDMLLDAAPSLMPHTKLPVSVWTSRDVRAIRIAIEKRINTELIANAYYKMVDGTSFSAPIVTSIVAQMLELDPTLTPADVKHILMTTANPLDNIPAVAQGAGVVSQRQALAAVRSLLSDAGRY
ncbi:MAG: serine protease [Ignavibacteriae bacterium]|nr:MAG: serine protease [Ignavibacteriota bacterium]